MTFEKLDNVKKADIARALGVHTSTVYRWSRQGIPEKKLLEAKTKAELMKEFEVVKEYKASRLKEVNNDNR